MKKKISGVFLIIFALIICNLPIPEVMASGVSNDFMVDGKKLIKYVGTATVVSIPDSIEVMGAEAFADLSELSGISISNKVHTIENGAF